MGCGANGRLHGVRHRLIGRRSFNRLRIVVAIDNFSAGDVIEIERPTGKRFMVPMRVEAVPEWDSERLVVEAAFATD